MSQAKTTGAGGGPAGRPRRRSYMLLALILLLLAVPAYGFLKGRMPAAADKPAAKTGAQRSAVLPERDADVYGVIISVRSNEITVLEFDPSTLPSAKQSTADRVQAGSGTAVSLGTGSSGLPGGGEMRVFTGGPGGSGGGSTKTTRESKMEELKEASMGTETITVPVGIPIVLQTDAAGGSSGTLKDLTADTIVKLWLEAGDGTGEKAAGYAYVLGTADMGNSK